MEGRVGSKNHQETFQAESRPIHDTPGVAQHPNSRFGVQTVSTSAGQMDRVCFQLRRLLCYAPQNEMWEEKVHRQKNIQTNLSAKGNDLPPLRTGQPVLVQDVYARKTGWRRGVSGMTVKHMDGDGQPFH